MEKHDHYSEKKDAQSIYKTKSGQAYYASLFLFSSKAKIQVKHSII